MTTNNNIFAGTGVALIALVSLALPLGQVFAADIDGGWDTDYYTDYSTPGYDSYGGWDTDSYTDYSTPGYDSYGGWDTDSYTDYSTPGYDSYGGWDTDYYTDYSTPDTYGGWDTDYYTDYANPTYDSGYSAPSFGGTSFGGGSSFGGYPSFGGGGIAYTTPINQQYRQQILPTLPTYAQPNVTSVCSAVNSCNTDNSYTDNSVYAPDNSYTMTDNSVYSAPTTVTVTAPTTVTTDSHNQQISYAQPEKPRNNYSDYDYPVYQPTYPTYRPQPSYPSYNTTPYISLSQAPYTGLDLGPVGEVLYWTFLVLWCLGAAYLIVVKRVQNKLVSALNGFLFGSTSLTTSGTKVAYSVPKAQVAASAPVATNDSIDSFIASQIKRS